jgi:uncharacterized protein YkwD
MIPLFALILSLPQPPPLPPPPLVLTSWEFQLVQATNQQRVQHGQWPLAVDAELMASARAHARWMAKHGYRHSGQPGENIASGQNTVAWVIADWMESPGHRANVLGKWQRIGVATATAPAGYRVWVQRFY